MKTIYVIFIIIFSSLSLAEEVDVKGGNFERIPLKLNEPKFQSLSCDFEILDEYRDTMQEPKIILGVLDSLSNEIIQVFYTTIKQGKDYLFSTKNDSVKNIETVSHFLTLPKKYGSKVTLQIESWGNDFSTFNYSAKVGQDIGAGGHITDPYLRQGHSYVVTFSSVKANYKCKSL